MTHKDPTPVDIFMGKRLQEKYPLPEWDFSPVGRFSDKCDYIDPNGNEWVRMLSGSNPRYLNPEDVAKGLAHYWDSPNYDQCQFTAVPMRRLHDDFIAVWVFKLHFYQREKYCNTTELVCDLVPCDWTGPDPVMRDVA